MNINNWQHVEERYEAFWDGKIVDRPLISVLAPAESGDDSPEPYPSPTGSEEEIYEWYTDADKVLANFEYKINHTYYAGDAIPIIFPMATSLPAIQAAYMGGDYHISPDNGSGWCKHSITDWKDSGKFNYDPDNKWWTATRMLLEKAGEKFAGKAFIGIPDIQGGGQILDSLRGTESLLIDFFDAPDEIKAFMPVIDTAWEKYWTECNDIILKHQEGYIDWLGLWSSKRMVTVECDVSVMISPDQFNEFFLPSLKRQIEFVDRSIYHLDGEGQICHLDSLLSLEKLSGIQWVPEPRNRDIRKFMSMFKRIRNAGKLVVLKGCLYDSETVKLVLDELGPEGVFISISCESPEKADALVESL
jgi:hypothetical protein